MDVRQVVPGKLTQTYAVMCPNCEEWALALDSRKDVALVELKESKWHKIEGKWHCERCTQLIAPELIDCGCDKKKQVTEAEWESKALKDLEEFLLPDGTIDYDKLQDVSVPMNVDDYIE